MPFVKLFCWQTSEKQLHKKEKKQLLQFYWRKSIMLNSSHFLQFPGNRLWTTECELLHRKDTTGVMTSGGPLPIYTTCWFSSQYRRWTKGFLLLFFFSLLITVQWKADSGKQSDGDCLCCGFISLGLLLLTVLSESVLNNLLTFISQFSSLQAKYGLLDWFQFILLCQTCNPEWGLGKEI